MATVVGTEEEYRVSPKQFAELLKNIVDIFNMIVDLSTALGQAGKGAYLAYPNPADPNQPLLLKRKHLKSARSRFAKTIMALNKYFRRSIRKKRDPVRPDSFKSQYSPIYGAEALTSFFTQNLAGFGSLHPITAVQTQQPGQALMEVLPLVQRGFLLRNSCNMLFHIYAHQNNLLDAANGQIARSDAVMTNAFGGAIPASWYSYQEGGVNKKILMQQAVASGTLPSALNTYQNIELLFPPGTTDKKGQDMSFNPGRFRTFFYQSMAAANFFSKAQLDVLGPEYKEAGAFLANADARAGMLAELNHIKQASQEWKALLEPGRKAQRDANKKAKDAAKKAAARG
jgi:hypothetical protein